MKYSPGTLNDEDVVARHNRKTRAAIRDSSKPTGSQLYSTTEKVANFNVSLAEIEETANNALSVANEAKSIAQSAESSEQASKEAKQLADEAKTKASSAESKAQEALDAVSALKLQGEIRFSTEESVPDGFKLAFKWNSPGGAVFAFKRIEEQ